MVVRNAHYNILHLCFTSILYLLVHCIMEHITLQMQIHIIIYVHAVQQVKNGWYSIPLSLGIHNICEATSSSQLNCWVVVKRAKKYCRKASCEVSKKRRTKAVFTRNTLLIDIIEVWSRFLLRTPNIHYFLCVKKKNCRLLTAFDFTLFSCCHDPVSQKSHFLTKVYWKRDIFYLVRTNK